LFAYKLTPDQIQAVQSQLPKWANTNRYDIQARAASNPTKDQFRLMMQVLLAERFNMAIHYETRQLPMLALVLDKRGKLGPRLRAHPDGLPCSTAPPAFGSAAPTVAGGFPASCGSAQVLQPSAPGRLRAGARNMSMGMIANSIRILQQNADRPILNKTGLTGRFDWLIEWTPETDDTQPPGAAFQPDPKGPAFIEALKQQLGLKLESQIGPVDVIALDHIEQPSEN
jgi:uncharacterized protein (TIGR03435 family)